MTPWQKAKAWQENNDSTATFAELVGGYMSAGYIWSTPQVFMLANEACWNSEEERFDDGPPNCWFVRLAASAGHANPVHELLRVAPYPHEYVGWCRRQQFEPRIYRWHKLMTKAGGN